MLWDPSWHEFSPEFGKVAADHPHTFGAALKRARKFATAD